MEFLSFKGGCTACLNQHMRNCHIVRNHMLWLIILFDEKSIVVMHWRHTTAKLGVFADDQDKFLSDVVLVTEST